MSDLIAILAIVRTFVLLGGQISDLLKKLNAGGLISDGELAEAQASLDVSHSGLANALKPAAKLEILIDEAPNGSEAPDNSDIEDEQ